MRDSQRLFLRSLMSKQFLSEKETKAVYQKACGVFGGKLKPFLYALSNFPNPGFQNMMTARQLSLSGFLNFVDIISDESPPENFNTFVEAINKNIKPLFLEIRRGISEEDGTVHFGLVRKMSKLIIN